MCGRFVGIRTIGELKQLFPIDEAVCRAGRNFNVAPTQEILAIARHNQTNILDKYHWGLVPFWAKDTAMGSKMINARSETVATKPSFRTAFKKRRCLIPADGFFEWPKIKGQKQPVYITLTDQAPMAFAGLWEQWRDPDNPSAVYLSCTIITRSAVGAMKKIHHRMPVILQPEVYGTWLNPKNQNPQELQEIFTGRILTDLAIQPVSHNVNAARHNHPSNIEPIQLEFDF